MINTKTILGAAIVNITKKGWLYLGFCGSGQISLRNGSNSKYALDAARAAHPYLSEFYIVAGAKKRYRSEGNSFAIVGR